MDIKSKIQIDHHGEYIYRNYFTKGKQKLRKVYLLNGIPLDKIENRTCYLETADDITLLKDHEYEELERRYSNSGNCEIKCMDDDEIPF